MYVIYIRIKNTDSITAIIKAQEDKWIKFSQMPTLNGFNMKLNSTALKQGGQTWGDINTKITNKQNQQSWLIWNTLLPDMTYTSQMKSYLPGVLTTGI